MNTKFNNSLLVNVTQGKSDHNGGSGDTPEFQMLHRCIIYLEGQDVGSSSYWALGSGSLMLAPAFLTSQNIIGLKPYVNYMPFNNDLSDIEQVVETHCKPDIQTDEVKVILENAKIAFMDLCDAKREAQRTFEMLRMIGKNVPKPWASSQMPVAEPTKAPDPSMEPPSSPPAAVAPPPAPPRPDVLTLSCPEGQHTLTCVSRHGEFRGPPTNCVDSFKCHFDLQCTEPDLLMLRDADGNFDAMHICKYYM